MSVEKFKKLKKIGTYASGPKCLMMI